MKITFSPKQGDEILGGDPDLGVLGNAASRITRFVGSHFDSLMNLPKQKQ